MDRFPALGAFEREVSFVDLRIQRRIRDLPDFVIPEPVAVDMLLILSEYQDCSHLLKRSYSDSEEHEKYNWMLDAEGFDLFEYKDRMRKWEDEQEFKIEAESLLTEILD